MLVRLKHEPRKAESRKLIMRFSSVLVSGLAVTVLSVPVSAAAEPASTERQGGAVSGVCELQIENPVASGDLHICPLVNGWQ